MSATGVLENVIESIDNKGITIADEWVPENIQNDLSSSSSFSEDNQSSYNVSNDSGHGDGFRSTMRSFVIPKAKENGHSEDEGIVLQMEKDEDLIDKEELKKVELENQDLEKEEIKYGDKYFEQIEKDGEESLRRIRNHFKNVSECFKWNDASTRSMDICTQPERSFEKSQCDIIHTQLIAALDEDHYTFLEKCEDSGKVLQLVWNFILGNDILAAELSKQLSLLDQICCKQNDDAMEKLRRSVEAHISLGNKIVMQLNEMLQEFKEIMQPDNAMGEKSLPDEDINKLFMTLPSHQRLDALLTTGQIDN